MALAYAGIEGYKFYFNVCLASKAKSLLKFSIHATPDGKFMVYGDDVSS